MVSDDKQHLGVQVRMDALEEGRPLKYDHFIVEKYKEHFSFLRDSKFLQDLENDSVDSDIIEEELSALHEAPISIREKVVKFLQSNPFQILLCVIVLLDAGIVIAQILLDLNSVKDKLHRRENQLFQLISHIKRTQVAKLCGYTGFEVDRILRLVGDDSTSPNCSPSAESTSDQTTSMSSSTNAYDRSDNWTMDMVTDHAPFSTSGQQARGMPGDTVGAVSGDRELDIEKFRTELQKEHDVLHAVAHTLHFASIAMLGFLVVEVLVKIIAMGKNFCKHKIEIFDAKIIIASFALDIIFLGGVAGEEGSKAAAVLVILLLWRIARVVDGIVVTVKQRQEFRIRLQKRARRTAERKMETFEEERHAKTKQIEALKDLCSKAGITDADIAACAPKHQRQVNTTLSALSSVARLSVSMTMLMSSGIYRPRVYEDGFVLPKVLGPTNVKDGRPQQRQGSQTKHHHHQPQGQGQAAHGTIPRIESLPIIENNSSSSSSQRGSQRKMAFVKSSRKKRGILSESYHLPVIETSEDGATVQASVSESSNPLAIFGLSASAQDAHANNGSPVNSSGVHILIDGSSDVECDTGSGSERPEVGDCQPETDMDVRDVCDRVTENGEFEAIDEERELAESSAADGRGFGRAAEGKPNRDDVVVVLRSAEDQIRTGEGFGVSVKPDESKSSPDVMA